MFHANGGFIPISKKGSLECQIRHVCRHMLATYQGWGKKKRKHLSKEVWQALTLIIWRESPHNGSLQQLWIWLINSKFVLPELGAYLYRVLVNTMVNVKKVHILWTAESKKSHVHILRSYTVAAANGRKVASDKNAEFLKFILAQDSGFDE